MGVAVVEGRLQKKSFILIHSGENIDSMTGPRGEEEVQNSDLTPTEMTATGEAAAAAAASLAAFDSSADLVGGEQIKAKNLTIIIIRL